MVVVDTDSRFDVPGLYAIMNHHIHRCHEEAESASTEVDAVVVVQSALQHVHVYRLKSAGALIEMLSGLAS